MIMDKKQHRRIGEILIYKGLLTPDKLEMALVEQAKTKEFLGEILLRRHFIDEKSLYEALAEQFDILFISLKNKYIDKNLLKEFTSSLILDFKCFPLEKNDWSVTMAITNPLDVQVLKKAEEEARGRGIKFVLVTKEDMQEVMKRYREYVKEDISKLFEQ